MRRTAERTWLGWKVSRTSNDVFSEAVPDDAVHALNERLDVDSTASVNATAKRFCREAGGREKGAVTDSRRIHSTGQTGIQTDSVCAVEGPTVECARL